MSDLESGLAVLPTPTSSDALSETKGASTAPPDDEPPTREGCRAGEHWRDEHAFRIVEAERREENSKTALDRLFVSHCWRDDKTQIKKRRIVARLSTPKEAGGPGLVYWGDFLDLQAEGPVPWRKEIEEGIAACSKFVAMVDMAWLTSYNCLQELVMAVHHQKPLVVVMLDQEGWDLLIVPGGAQRAKVAADKIKPNAQGAWVNGTHGPPLCMFEGQQIVPGKPLTLGVITELFAHIASINLCPCRPLDEQNSGWKGILSLAETYVCKDLVYHKEHAHLKNKATAWEHSVKHGGPRPLLQETECAFWAEWLAKAEEHGIDPKPTDSQRQFVAVSRQQTARRQRILRFLGVVLICVLAAGVGASAVLAVRALKAEAEALESADKATAAQQAAEKAQRAAEREASRATEAAQVATAMACSSAMYRDPYGSTFAFKLLNESLARLPSPKTQVVNSTLVRAGRHLLQKPFHFVKQIFKGHQHVIYTMAWSPDGGLLASASVGGTVMVQRPAGAVDGDAELSPDVGQFLESGQPGTSVISLVWAPGGQHLLGFTHFGRKISLWSRAPGRMLNSTAQLVDMPWLPTDMGIAMVHSVTWSPFHTEMAFGCYAGVYVCSVSYLVSNATASALEFGSCRLLDSSSVDDVNSVDWSPDGMQLASGSSNGNVRVWKRTGREDSFNSDTSVHFVLSGHSDDVNAVEWSPDSVALASAAADDTVRVWTSRCSNETPEAQVLYGHSGNIQSVAWNPDGRSLASGSTDKTVRLWTVGEAYQMSAESAQVIRGHENTIDVLAWHPDGIRLATASTDNSVRLWTVRRTGALPAASEQTMDIHSDEATGVSWSPDGQKLATVSTDMTLKIWLRTIDNGLNGGLLINDTHPAAVVEAHTDEVLDVAWSPAHSSLTLATGSSDATVKVWSVNHSGEIDEAATRVLEGHTEKVWSISWLGNGLTLASSASDGTVRLWGAPFAEPAYQVLRPPGDETMQHVFSVAWSPNRLSLAAAYQDGYMRLWRVSSPAADNPMMVPGQELLAHDGDFVLSVAWAPSSRALAAGARDSGHIKVWVVSPDGVVTEDPPPQLLPGHANDVNSLAWSPKGLSLLSGSDDTTAILWAVGPGGAIDAKTPLVLYGHLNYVTSVAWSPDGLSVVTASYDSTVRIWRLLDVDTIWLSLQEVGLWEWAISNEEILLNNVPLSLYDAEASAKPVLGGL